MAHKKPLVIFRPTILEDLESYKEWLQQPGVLEGFPMSDKREIDDAVRLWRQYLAKGASITALYKKKPVGAASLYVQEVEKLKHQSLFVILVDEKYRGQGIGTLLLKKIQKLAKNTFGIEILHLEVYDKNPAIRLYERVGFKKYARHPDYLKDRNGNYFGKILMQMEL
ncbi:MAG: GNAT family N-acetyltransferase [Simkaniaceae bacterium]|nr:GNAT family N-acetyltransferase [Simkaniaceae bacterium]